MAEKILKSIAGTHDRPLIIGDIEIPCYVLEDETRVLVQTEMIYALGMSRGSSGGKSGDRLAKFVRGNALKPFVSKDILNVTGNPIKFNLSPNTTAYGYKAIILPDLCGAVLDARNAGALQAQQQHIAKRCELLIRFLAKIGIIALVDEATGYQELRAKDALAKILEDFIAKELQPWTRTFPLEFYQEIYRLKKWSFPELAAGKKPKTPSVLGIYTNDIVYNRLAPGVLKELQIKNPIIKGRSRKALFTQWFTPDIGHPKLKEHLAAVIAIMRLSSSWKNFQVNLQKSFPMKGDQFHIEEHE